MTDKRVSDERLADDLHNNFHENEWDRKTAEDLVDERAASKAKDAEISQLKAQLETTQGYLEDFMSKFAASATQQKRRSSVSVAEKLDSEGTLLEGAP